jgi:hypothetical protein
MIPYEAPAEVCADPTTLIGTFVIFALLCMTYEEVPLDAAKDDHCPPTREEILEKELEMAHKHQDVLEEDIKNLEASVALLSVRASQPQNLQAAITGLLQKKAGGLVCKQLLSTLALTMPEITKKDVNSTLYKMKVKKIVKIKSNFDKVPVWLLTA